MSEKQIRGILNEKISKQIAGYGVSSHYLVFSDIINTYNNLSIELQN